ncbi:MAG: DUF4416 family protein [Pseudomonadota bacterium]
MSDAFQRGPQAEPPASLIVMGMLANDLALARKAAEFFGKNFGDVDLLGEPKPFDQTCYYEPEMGPGLNRVFCSFNHLATLQQLPQLKHLAWETEKQFSVDNQRTVNLDPGLLDHSKVILASFKPGPQKLYLGDRVWADMVLYFADGSFGPLPWTFPDLRGEDHSVFFTNARTRYKAILRKNQK